MTTALLTALFLTLAVQDPKTLGLALKDGKTIEAQVLGIEGDSVRLKVFGPEGSQMQLVRELDDFVPSSVFTIEMAAQPPTDFDGHFRMAKRAAELGLVAQIGTAARAAIDAAKDDEKRREEVRAWAADTVESLLRAAVAEARLDDAHYYVKLLSTRFSDLRTEEEIDALEDHVQGLQREHRSRLQSERQAKADEKARTEIGKRLQPIEKRIEEGDKKLREAIRKSRNTAQSSGLCEKAIEAYASARKELDEIAAKVQDDPGLDAEVHALNEYAQRNSLRAALHAANLLIVQSDYKGAMEWTARVLEADPENAEAKEMTQTIQVAAAAASGVWGWGWRVGGVGGSRPQDR